MRRTGKVKEMFLCPFHEYKKPSCDVCTYRNTETRTSLGPCQIYPDATKTQGCLGKKELLHDRTFERKLHCRL